jgi:hypothetical protein
MLLTRKILHLNMKAITIIGVFLLLAHHLNSQQITYKDSIDKVLKQYRKGNKVFNDKDENIKRRYYYHKKSKQISTIIISNTSEHSGTIYYFLNAKLVTMSIYLPYSAMPSSKGKPMSSAYYFKDENLVDKYEVNFPKVDVEKYKMDGLQLYEEAVMHLRNKGVIL